MSEARDIENERILREMSEDIARLAERFRTLVLAYQQDRKDIATKSDLRALASHLKQYTTPPLPTPPPAPEQGGIFHAIGKHIASGGWPATALVASPFALGAVGLLVWYSVSTGTPLTSLLLALFGVAHGIPSGSP